MARIPRIEISADVIRSNSGISLDKSIERAMFRIGSAVKNQIKTNIRNQGIVQSGRLFDSIDFKIEKKNGEWDLVMGAFDNNYAHIVEFGSDNITDRVRRAMFARMREESIPKSPGKGIIEGQTYRERPFMRPAFDTQKGQILAFLRDASREFDILGKSFRD